MKTSNFNLIRIATISVALVFSSSCILIVDNASDVALTVTENQLYTLVNQSVTIAPSGGSGSYSFEITSGSGTITAEGVYTAGSSADTVVVTVSSGTNTAAVTINVANDLTVTPNVKALIIGQTKQLTVSGGFSPYTYSTSSMSGSSANVGSVSASGLYTSRASFGKDLITVTDSKGNTTTASLYSLVQMQLWLDAGEITGVADSTQFAQWDDLSGSGNHATQAVAGLRPTYLQTHSISPAGKPLVAFFSQYFLTPEFMNSQSMTFAAVGNMTSNSYFIGDDATGGRQVGLGVVNVSGVDRYATYMTDGTTNIIASSDDNSVARVVAGQTRNQIASVISGGNQSVASDPAYNIGSWETNGLVTGPTIGIFATAGFINELFAYTSALTVAQLNSLQCYLSEKYELTLSFSCP